MKKKLLCLLGVSLLAIGLGACGGKDNGGDGGDNTPVQPAKQTFTVGFEVDGTRVPHQESKMVKKSPMKSLTQSKPVTSS